MTWEENNYLVHYGISGQKWHVRRFQNEDGTLTEEGKRRYSVKDMNSKQRSRYFSLGLIGQRNVRKKLNAGKDIDQSLKEEGRKAAITGAVLGGAYLYLNPYTRPFMKMAGAFVKSAAKAGFRTVKNSNVAKKGSLWLKKMTKQHNMVKNGAVILGKKNYSVSEYIPKFGGYLGR